MKTWLLGAICFFSSLANAESVVVKYRGVVDLAFFQCESIDLSSFISRVCYDSREQYMVINLNGTYYHYCAIGADVVSELKSAASMGRYYNAQIKGRFDCRINRMPSYR